MTANPPKRPLRNLIKLLSDREYVELLKVIRRRTLNALKVLRLVFWRVFGIAYDHPAVKLRREQRRLKGTLRQFYSYDTDKPAQATQVALILREGTSYPKSSAFIRLISPLTDESVKEKVLIKLFPENTVELPSYIDVCIVQRTAFDDEPTASKLVKNLKSIEAKLVVDNDDAFSIIDPSHPEHKEHKDRVEAINFLIREADQAWVSVPKLKDYQPRAKKDIIMRNSLDPRLWLLPEPHHEPFRTQPLQLLYMGTVSHDADLAMIMPALAAVQALHPGSFELTVIGVTSDLPDYWWIKRLYQKRGVSIYPKFVRWFLEQGTFDIGLSPLVNNEFNNAKSDIKCLDYLAAGIVPLVSDIEPYRVHELDDYIIKVKNNSDEWRNSLLGIATDRESFRRKAAEMIPKAQDYLWSKRSSAITAQVMLSELEKLTSKNT